MTRKNSIAYPGERAPKRSAIVEQPGYTGKNYFTVRYAGRQLKSGWARRGQKPGGRMPASCRSDR